MIADGKKVLIELAIVGPDGQSRVEGDLVFEDAGGTLAGPLKQLFDHIDGQSVLVTSVVEDCSGPMSEPTEIPKL